MNPLPIDVVSVQSQVVYGRVGNNVAVPALESMGFTVAAVPTVVFSNTPHYPTIHGGALPVDWFEGYLRDLVARGATAGLRAILTGYLGSPLQADALAQWARQLSRHDAALRIVMDPVLGDRDCGLYVDAGLVDAYRRDLLPLADGITPNGFELELLTGRPVDDADSVIAAARTLLVGRTRWVAVTSAAPAACAADEMQVMLVTREHAELIRHARVDVAPKGTGDLFCATLAGHWLQGSTLPQAVRSACRHVVEALHLTQQAASAELMLAPRDWRGVCLHRPEDSARRQARA